MVYVDNMGEKFGRIIMFHMIADSKEELFEMADNVGVKRKWIQCEGTWKEHFDISLGAKKKALLLGAKEIGRNELSNLLRKRTNNIFKK